jgi:hypothetical protein
MLIVKPPIAPFLLCVTVATNVSAYIDDSMVRRFGRKPTNYSPTDWSPMTSVAPKVTSRAPVPSASTISQVAMPPPIDANDVIRAEYGAWSIRYGKTMDDRRFEIFKHNFMTQMEYNRKTGEFYLLNEYGDITAEEYEEMMAIPTSASEDPPLSRIEIPSFAQEVEDVVAPAEQVIPRIVEMGIGTSVEDYSMVDTTISNIINKINAPSITDMSDSSQDVVYFSKIDAAVASINKIKANGAVPKRKRATRPVEPLSETGFATTSRVSNRDGAPVKSTTISRKGFFSNLNTPTKGAFILCLGSMLGSATQVGNFVSEHFE